MSWASRRKTAYASGVFLFFATLIGVPLAYWYFSIPPTCTDGKRNQGETSADRGGPCLLLDDDALTPPGLLWARSFRVRDGAYSAVAYMQNPNSDAGVRSVRYKFTFYDERNVLVTEREGTTFIMPGGVTPIFEGNIDAGSRIIAHTYFEFVQSPRWERLADAAYVINIDGTAIADERTIPRLTTTVTNTSVREVRDIEFVAIVSDPAGNAFAASQTALPILYPGQSQELTFTWPTPFHITVGRITVHALVAPASSTP